MRGFISWVETGVAGRLGIMGCPSGGSGLDVEVQGLCEEGVQTVVSLLTREEEASLGLQGERRACENAGLKFLSFPIQDQTVPPRDASLLDFLHALRNDVRAGTSVAVHCRFGIGRSGVMAASVLTLLGIHPEEALARLSAARGGPVPNTREQLRWVLGFPAFAQKAGRGRPFMA